MIYSPVVVTCVLVIWTFAVAPFARYGVAWTWIPVVFALPLVVLLHVALAVRTRRKAGAIIYGLAHTVLLAVIWLDCLMFLSKESL